MITCCQCLSCIATGIFLFHLGQGRPPLPDDLFHNISFQIQHKHLLSQYLLFPIYVKQSSAGIFSLFPWFFSTWAAYLSTFLIVITFLWSLLPLERRSPSFPPRLTVRLGWQRGGCHSSRSPGPADSKNENVSLVFIQINTKHTYMYTQLNIWINTNAPTETALMASSFIPLWVHSGKSGF